METGPESIHLEEGQRLRAGALGNGKQTFDLFISFSASDTEYELFGRRTNIVSEIKKRLEAFRHPHTRRRLRVCTYVDDFDLNPEIEQAIHSKLDSSEAVLVICTAGAAASPYVKMELEHSGRTKPSGRLIPALVKTPPSTLFPGVFLENTLAANMSAADLTSHKAWAKRVEIECAKIAARVWDLRLLEFYDRFVIERQRRRMRLFQAAALALVLITVGASAAVMNFLSANQARSLASHRRFAAEIASLDRAWNSAGDIEQAKRLIERLDEGLVDKDAKPFELAYFSNITSAERYSIGEYADPAEALAVASNGSWAAVATQQDPVMVFDPRDGHRLNTLSPATADAWALKTAGSDRLLVGTAQGLAVWTQADAVETLIAVPIGVKGVEIALRPDGLSGVMLSEDGGVYEFDLPTGTLINHSKLTGEGPRRAVFTGDGETLVVFGPGREVDLLDGLTLEPRTRVSAPGMRLEGEFATWKDLAIFSAGDRVGVIDTRSGELLLSEFMGGLVTTIDVHETGALLAIGGNWKGFELWQTPDLRDPKTWRFLEALRPITGWAASVHFLPRADMLIGASLGGDIRGWDTSRIGMRSAYVHAPLGHVSALQPLQGSDDIVSGDSEGLLRRWNPQTAETVWERTFDSEVEAIALGLEADRILAADQSGKLHVLDASTGASVEQMSGWAPLARSHQGNKLAWIGESGQSVEILDRDAATKRASIPVAIDLSGEEAELDIVSMALSPSGDTVAVGTGDGRLVLIDTRGRRISRQRVISESVLWSLAFSPDGKQIAVGGSDSFVRVIGASQLEDVAFLSGHWNTVFSLDFSPDGATLVSAGRDGVMRFWNTGAWQETMALSRHAADLDPGVRVVAFDETGDRLYSGGAGGRIIVWESEAMTSTVK